MQLTRFNYFFYLLFLSVFLYVFAGFFSKNAYSMSLRVQTYIVVSKNDSSSLQSLAIKKALILSLKKAVIKLVNRNTILTKNSKNDKILNKNIYSDEMHYIYSFKVLKAQRYLNLYYIETDVMLREKILKARLNGLGFNVVKKMTTAKSTPYSVYYIMFKGSYKYADPNKLQKLMIIYSKHLNNLYVSSFSDNFVEIKVLYYGSIIRLLKSVENKVKTYLNAKVYPVKGNTIVVDVK